MFEKSSMPEITLAAAIVIQREFDECLADHMQPPTPPRIIADIISSKIRDYLDFGRQPNQPTVNFVEASAAGQLAIAGLRLAADSNLGLRPEEFGPLLNLEPKTVKAPITLDAILPELFPTCSLSNVATALDDVYEQLASSPERPIIARMVAKLLGLSAEVAWSMEDSPKLSGLYLKELELVESNLQPESRGAFATAMKSVGRGTDGRLLPVDSASK